LYQRREQRVVCYLRLEGGGVDAQAQYVEQDLIDVRSLARPSASRPWKVKTSCRR
jgi:hypothetical protein